MIKKLLLTLMVALCLYGTARLSHHKTKGFRLSKLSGNVTSIQDQISPDMPMELRQKFHQKFHYLGRGIQSFSFISEDGQLVLKLFNNRYQRRLFWMNLPLIRNLKKEKIAYNNYKLRRTFNSYQIAFNDLKEESGLLYFHPQVCHNCPKVTLIDPINIAHTIDLSKHAFCVQKKAVLPFPYFSKCSKNGDIESAKRGLQSLVKLLQKKMQLGINDNDPLIRTNVGFIGEKAIQIDIGPFTYEPEEKNSEQQKEEITKIMLSLKHWMEKNTPSFLPYYDEAINSL